MRIALIVQRCGKEIVGGAENVCLNIGQRLAKYHDVDILTTCALDYVTWNNHFPEGTTKIDGFNLIRFKTDYERDILEFNSLSEKIFFGNHSIENEKQWMKLQGPYSSQLFNYIQENKEKYDLFIFFTYLYATTFYGMQHVASKSILVPLAHDEPPLKLKIYDDIFQKANDIIFSTEEEQKLVLSRFNLSNKGQLIGLGVNNLTTLPNDFSSTNSIKDDYVLYLGRIDKSKGCDELIEFFNQYKKDKNSNLKLVLVGPIIHDFEKNQNIVYLGELDNFEKSYALQHMSVFIMPSSFESFSIATMEAWLAKKPVIVNSKSQVLKGHCEKCNGGLYYENYKEFSECLDFILNNKSQATQMGINGYHYVKENYTWEKIANKYRNFVENKIDELP